jgi:hypothetical protein
MSDAYTIRIFVPDGDPENSKLVTPMNWTGVGNHVSPYALGSST